MGTKFDAINSLVLNGRFRGTNDFISTVGLVLETINKAAPDSFTTIYSKTKAPQHFLLLDWVNAANDTGIEEWMAQQGLTTLDVNAPTFTCSPRVQEEFRLAQEVKDSPFVLNKDAVVEFKQNIIPYIKFLFKPKKKIEAPVSRPFSSFTDFEIARRFRDYFEVKAPIITLGQGSSMRVFKPEE